MEAFLHQVLAGLATGGIYASLALALVMIYQATHLVNFAQGEMAMFATYLAWSLIDAGMPTRLYYCGYRHNAFDTHVHQVDLHRRLLTYTADAVAGFFRDLERIGKADQVTMMIFSEFGRRVPENTSLGTDHGTAGLMFVAGKPVKGGHYGTPPSLTALDPGDNLVHTADFRRVYATVIQGWLGYPDTDKLLNGRFEPFPMFA